MSRAPIDTRPAGDSLSTGRRYKSTALLLLLLLLLLRVNAGKSYHSVTTSSIF